MNQAFVIFFFILPLLLGLSVAVMWIFFMESALRMTLFIIGLLLLIALQAGMWFPVLIGYRQGSHWMPALGVAAQMVIIWAFAKQVRDLRRRHPNGIMRIGWSLCLISISAVVGLIFTAWSAIGFALTGEVMQLVITVAGTGLLAVCTTAAIKSCNRQRVPIDTSGIQRLTTVM